MNYSEDLLNYWMETALAEAERAAARGEVPVGAVIVKDGEILTRAGNRVEELQDASGHAEMLAIRDASSILGHWRLTDCTLISTLEPCPMCAGLIRLCRISTVVFGASDERWGACGSRLSILQEPVFGPEVKVISGLRQPDSSVLLKDFFKSRRS